MVTERLPEPGECTGIYTQRRSGLLDSHWSNLTSQNVTIILDESRSRVVLRMLLVVPFTILAVIRNVFGCCSLLSV